MKFKLAIFDLDGTLMNTSAGIFASANAAVVKLGLPAETDITQLSKFIGPPIVQCFVNTYNLDEELIPQAVSYYRDEYDTKGQYNAEPYPSVKDTLSKLREQGYLLAVGTLKHEHLAQNMMAHFGFDPFFDSIRGADMESKLSKADIVKKVLEDLAIEASDAVLIGDTIHDQNGAKEAGVSFIAVDYGFGFPKGQKSEDNILYVASKAEDLLTVL